MAGDSASKSWFDSFWVPVAVVGLAATASAGVLFYPDPDFADFMRNVFILGIASAAVAGLLLWFVFAAAFSWRGRILGLVVLGALAAGATQAVEFRKFSGNLKPEFRFVWDKSQADLIRESRAATGKAEEKAIAFTGREPGNFSQYRGDNFDGIVKGLSISKDWNSKPPKLLWKQPIGGGYAQIAVAGDVAVTIEQRDSNEAVVCYDSLTGKERWVHEYPAHFKEVMGGEGPRATPTLRDGRVYSIGAEGRLVCLDGSTGKVLWSADALEKSGRNIAWGVSCSPLLHEKTVIVAPGANKNAAAGNAIVAYDIDTGKKTWAAGDHYAGYSTPRISMLCGSTVMVLLDGDGLAGVDPVGGKELFRFPWVTQEKIHVAQPIVFNDDRVFITSGYGTGCAMLKIKKDGDKWSIEPIWTNKLLRCRFTSPVVRDGFIYGLDEGIMTCLDAKTGERKWKKGRYGNGQILLVDDVILVQQESGKLALIEANPKELVELGQSPGVEGNTWNCPAIAAGKLYVRSHLEMACYELAPR